MYKEHEVKKRYFTIGEVADFLKVNPSKLRFYEDEFSISPNRSRKNIRLYLLKDVILLKCALILSGKGFSLKLVSDILKMNKEEMEEYFINIVNEIELIR